MVVLEFLVVNFPIILLLVENSKSSLRASECQKGLDPKAHAKEDSTKSPLKQLTR